MDYALRALTTGRFMDGAILYGEKKGRKTSSLRVPFLPPQHINKFHSLVRLFSVACFFSTQWLFLFQQTPEQFFLLFIFVVFFRLSYVFLFFFLRILRQNTLLGFSFQKMFSGEKCWGIRNAGHNLVKVLHSSYWKSIERQQRKFNLDKQRDAMMKMFSEKLQRDGGVWVCVCKCVNIPCSFTFSLHAKEMQHCKCRMAATEFDWFQPAILPMFQTQLYTF